MKTSIVNSTIEDIKNIFELYAFATKYQKNHFPGNVWPKFSNELIKQEIHDNRQWKLVIDNEIACIWAITYNDAQIWEEKDKDAAIYIHRISANPKFRGYNFVEEIVTWAKEYAKSINKNFIRMDTCGDNTKLIHHYTKCGFNFLGMSKLKNTSELPSHYHNAEVCFFEIKL